MTSSSREHGNGGPPEAQQGTTHDDVERSRPDVRLVGIDASPPRRPAAMDPWQDHDPETSVEGGVAREILGQLRRLTFQYTGRLRRQQARRWTVGLILVSLLVAAALVALIWRAQIETSAAVSTSAAGAQPSSEAIAPEQYAKARAELVNAFQTKRYERAFEIGNRLDESQSLDPAAQFMTADAARRIGRKAEALRRYNAFLQRPGQHARTDDAHFWAAELLRERGELGLARRHYRAVLRNPRSSFRSSAQRRLAELNR